MDVTGQGVWAGDPGESIMERTEHGRINASRRLGERFIKVTYKDLGEELLIISAVDKSD
jgi:hypothetical protein